MRWAWIGIAGLSLAGMGSLLLSLHRGPKNDLSIYGTAKWWNPNGSFGILARMNVVRVPYFLTFIPSKATVIDLGCGGGLVTESVSRERKECSVTGFDISEGALAQARVHAKDQGVNNVVYETGSLYSIPRDNESVDCIIVSDVLEHLEDVPKALGEMFRVLKPGGVVVFDTIAKTYWSWLSTYFVAQEILGIVEPGAHDWGLFINPEDLEAMLLQAGFVADRTNWKGICAKMSLSNALSMRSKYHLIESFYASETDLRASYMGFAMKPISS
jgi:2-polyprenyl-6-hydroxyphenyl methylase/3-demethylubiquinone-9 3-methyltransferase